MDEETYIKERVDDQITWYDKKSISHQRKYKWMKKIQIIFSALIPFTAGCVKFFPVLTYVISIFGVIITCIEGIVSLNKYHENWIEYRSICETLQHEKFMYITKSGVYKEDDLFPFFVERVESIISRENVNWAALNNNEK